MEINDVDKYKRLAKDTVTFAIGNFGTRILSFLLVSLYTSYLSTDEYGKASVFNTTISLLLPVLTISIAESVLRFLHDKDIDENSIISIGISVLIRACASALVLATIMCIFFPQLREYYVFFIIIFPLTAIEASFSNIAKGKGKTKVFAAKGILYTLVFCVSNILLLSVFNLRLRGLFISYILAYSVSCVYMFVFAGIYKTNFNRHYDKKLFRDMQKYSVPFIPAAISWWINSSSDTYMLLWMVGPGAIGLYAAAQKVSTMITAVTSIFMQAWQLSAMQNYKDDDFDDYFTQMFRFITIILLLGACVVFVINKLIATCLFKNEFYEAWKFVPMLTMAAVFSTINGFLASAFTSFKKTNILFISTCISAVINIIMNVALISICGILGAAIATAFSFFVMVVIRLITIKNVVVIKTSLIEASLSVSIMFITAILVAYIEQYYLITTVSVCAVLIFNYKTIFQLSKQLLNIVSNKG